MRSLLTRSLILAAGSALCLHAASFATNGMFMTGYGAESLGRGGANLAISDRSLALNFNPAGIGQLQGDHFTLGLALLAPSLEFENMANPRTDGEDTLFPLPSFAWIRSKPESRWAFGFGFLAQGGMGAEFRDLNTFFGTRDEIFTEVSFATISPTVAYSPNEDFAVGLTANIGYAEASFKFFPNTSFFNTQMPEMSFFGVDMDGTGGLQYSLRLGTWWRPHPRFTVGLVYQTETESDFGGGDLTVNFTNQPQVGGKVRYDAEMEGFTFAAQAGIGFGWRLGERWIAALDVKRYFWDDAIDTILVRGTNPNAQAPPELVLPFVFDWKDQWVYALGFDYRATDRLTLRFGGNYGENPVPDDTLTPLFPANVSDHLSIGFGYLHGNKTWEFALERTFAATQTNDNPNPLVNPFGPGSTVEHDQWVLAVSLSWAN